MLLDTHVLIWWLNGDTQKLSAAAHSALANRALDLFISAASIWELGIKHSTGKLPEAAVLLSDPAAVLQREGFREIAISIDHARRASSLPVIHKDPFDRMLAAQAQAEGMPLMSRDTIFDRYGVTRLW